jgi:peptidoglycan/xylan/chitin deacetylase (PgdA/CDA1 family)
MAMQDDRRIAREERRRRVIRQRRALAAGAVIALVALSWILIASGGGGGQAGGRQASHAPGSRPPAHMKPTAVDRVLGYTDYIEKGRPRRREVALTFDDGPSPWTPKLVKALRRRHVAATFFPIGYAIARYRGYLKLERRDGFTIGDHTMNHPLMGRLQVDIQANEIDGQARLLRRDGVAYPRLFRPPYGSFNDVTRDLLQQRRMLMVLWSVNPSDYYRPGTQTIVSRVLAGVTPGAIVLMHDGGGDRSQTVAAVPAIVRKLRARGYRIVTIPRLLTDDPPPHTQGPPPNLAGI